MGYKGFDKNLQCRGFQYEIGGEYQHDGLIGICKQGFHFCENPLDVLDYYAPGKSRFAKVEGSGAVERESQGDSKVVCSHLKVGEELTLRDLIQAGAKFVLEKAKGTTAATTGDGANAVTVGSCAHAATTGNRAHAATTGYYAHAATTGGDAHAATTGDLSNAVTVGNYAHAVTTGDGSNAVTVGNYAHAVTTGYLSYAAAMGKESIAAGLGFAGRVQGALGCWLVLAEYRWTEDDRYRIAAVKAARVDGKRIKPNTWYELKDGEFIETEEEEA